MKEDSGDYFRDPNSARFPSYPTEPAVQAIFRIDPRYPTSSINIFACGSTLGNLLRFVRGVDKPFRFTVEKIGNTVFFVRKENSPTELITDVRGFGHTFPEAYVPWEPDVKGSESHQRLIQYSFGGLTCLVRFECDGYFGSSTTSMLSGADSSTAIPSDNDELVGLLQAISITQPLTEMGNSLKIKSGGFEVPQVSIFDLKTRSKRSKFKIDMDEHLPLLYLKQIPNFVAAYHDGFGQFSPKDIKVQNLQKDMERWESDNKDALKRLAILLHKITEFAKSDGKGLLEVYCPSADCLQIYKQLDEGVHALPLSLREEWAGTATELEDDSKSSSESHESCETTPEEDYYDLLDSDSDGGIKDLTACSEDTCGYCGKCSY